jgi:hypothetical protein
MHKRRGAGRTPAGRSLGLPLQCRAGRVGWRMILEERQHPKIEIGTRLDYLRDLTNLSQEEKEASWAAPTTVPMEQPGENETVKGWLRSLEDSTGQR